MTIQSVAIVTRIAPAEEPLSSAMADRMLRIFPAGLPLPQLYLTMARNEPLFCHLIDIGLIGQTGLLDRRVLAKDLREAVILRTCVALGNDYEFNLHVQTISERMGLSRAKIDDVRAVVPSPTLWPEPMLAALKLVDAAIPPRKVDDVTYEEARRHFDEATLIEIVQIVGLYVGVAMLVGLARPQFDRYRPGSPELTGKGGGQ
jgi:4-carboxymuconolactone decarboxylase